MAEIIFTEGSNVANSIYGNSQYPIRLFIEKQAEAFEKKSMLPYLFSMEKSTHWAEKYTGMSSMDDFVATAEAGSYPGIASGTSSATMAEKAPLVLQNVTWKNQFNISREMVDDSNLIDFRKEPLAFIASYYRTREKLGGGLYSAAIAGTAAPTIMGGTFSTLTPDGKALFANHKPTGSSSTQMNNKFTLEFSADALSEVETAMQNFVDDKGNIVNVTPDTIVIPNSGALKRKVFAAIGADKDPATSNNGYNYQFGRWNVVVSPYITDVAGKESWILLDSTYMKNYAGAVFQTRTELDVRSVVNEDNDNNQWKGYARFTAGFGDWRYVAMSQYTPST